RRPPNGAAAGEAAGAVPAPGHRTALTPMATSYAIVETGGKQYRAEKGTSLVVEHLSADQGAKVSLRAVMYRGDNEVVLEGERLEKVKVEAVVAEHLRGPKLRVFKYKAKKGYRRRAGHRQELTRLEVTDVKLLTRKPAAKVEAEPAQKAEAKPAEKAEAEPVQKAEAEPKAPAKPTAKKPTTKAKPAAKKPAAKKPAAKKPAAKKPAGSGKAQATRKASPTRRSSSAKKES
ncbi:MAG: 50S ribosomal protein L21, partial [Actinomycetota bacterium]